MQLTQMPAENDLDAPGQGPLLDILAKIHVALGKASDDADKDRAYRRQLLQEVGHIEIPPMGGTPNVAPFGSGVLGLGNADMHGPRTGMVWDIRRITVTGTGSSEVVSLYRVSGNVAGAAVGANLIATFTGTNPAPYGPGKGGVMLRAGQFLFLYGTGLTNASTYQLNGDAISMTAENEGAYLL